MNNGQPKALYYGHLSGMRSLFALFLSIISTQVMATHIIGGNMYYDHLGGNQYRVTLVLYRDCGPDNANNTGFDAAAQLAVYNAAGQQVTSTDVAYSGEDPSRWNSTTRV
jgi:hypothetical protein